MPSFVSYSLLALAALAPFSILAHPAQKRDDSITIGIQNAYGAPLALSFGTNEGFPGFFDNPQPQTLLDATYTQFSAPAGWAGRIIVNRENDYNPSGSKIEGSFYGEGTADIDVSYVDGYSVPITCGMGNGITLTGCNIELFNTGSCDGSGDWMEGNVCRNGAQGLPDGPASGFFAPCTGAAYTFPKDDGANVGNQAGGFVMCCVGTGCAAPATQRG